MSSIAFEPVLASRPVTPDSFSRLPKNSMPSSGRPPGASSAVTSSPMIGKTIFSKRDTLRPGFIRISRSSRVVSSFMIGGWMIGTIAM